MAVELAIHTNDLLVITKLKHKCFVGTICWVVASNLPNLGVEEFDFCYSVTFNTVILVTQDANCLYSFIVLENNDLLTMKLFTIL